MKKRLFIAAAFVLLTAISQAQSPGIKFGIHAGTSIANMKYEEDEYSYSPKSIFGIQGGFVADLQLGKHLSLQPGVNFVQKGMKIKSDENGSNDTYTERINAIEIPINILYNSKGNAGNLFVGAGPSFSFAMAGKYIEKIDGETDKEKMSFGNNEMDDDYRAFDFGVNGMIGYEFKGGLFMAANYNLGLRNLLPGGDEDYGKVKTNYFGVRLGYFFNRK
jgi:Outer membrane protein beta-barrel domain